MNIDELLDKLGKAAHVLNELNGVVDVSANPDVLTATLTEMSEAVQVLNEIKKIQEFRSMSPLLTKQEHWSRS